MWDSKKDGWKAVEMALQSEMAMAPTRVGAMAVMKALLMAL